MIHDPRPFDQGGSRYYFLTIKALLMRIDKTLL